MSQLPTPRQIASALFKRVIGQEEAVREVAVALAKKLAKLKVGNVLLIGSSGSGKTTLMRALEELLGANATLAARSTAIRVHANVLAEEVQDAMPGQGILTRLIERAREQLGLEAPLEDLVARAAQGLVFIDEIDKIRSHIGDRVNVAGIRAQEALLTLIENEAVPFRVPDWAGGETIQVDSSGLLFICAGAFEGLYDSVYRRVSLGEGEQALKGVTVTATGKVREEIRFSLRDWLRSEDLFAYGMAPQFLSRFDAVVLLDSLGEDELYKIFVESADSALRQSHAYFASQGIRLEMTAAAARRIAATAARQPRLGARALKEVFRRVIRPYEFDPQQAPGLKEGRLRIDVDDVARVLERDEDAVTSLGWSQGDDE